MTGVKLKLLTDRDMHLFFEEGIRGGISMIANRYAKANHKYVGGYDPEEDPPVLDPQLTTWRYHQVVLSLVYCLSIFIRHVSLEFHYLLHDVVGVICTIIVLVLLGLEERSSSPLENFTTQILLVIYICLA